LASPSVRIRHHLSLLPAVATDILVSLLNFSPQDRPPLYDILTSDLFQEFHLSTGMPQQQEGGDAEEMVYLHYYRQAAEGQLRAHLLPSLKRL
jgi:hypothetical protein